MKYEWRKKDKEIYLAKEKPQRIEIAEYKFIAIEGKGNPNEEQFSRAVEALYNIAYTIKMLPKKGIIPEGYFDYTVFPLEGLWSKPENAKITDKNKFIYTLMIRQPDFVTEKVLDVALNNLKAKKSNDLFNKVKLVKINDGLCVQMLHIGCYDDEFKTFSKMDKFCIENNLVRRTDEHREIYLSDPRKTQQEKLKTTLRYCVKKKNDND